jgi:dienelactone hydrolase
VLEDLVLTGSSGLRIRATVRSPRNAGGSRRPAILIMAGIGTGRRVVTRIPAGDRPLVWMSVDYPYDPPASWDGLGTLFRELPRAERGAIEALAGIGLALEYLESRPDVDPARTALAGGSLGAFFAVVGGALHPGFEAVASLYGGGDLSAIVRESLPWRSQPLRSAAARALNPWLGPVDPALFAARISPRPFLMVNGSRDTRIPRASVLALYDAAREPRELIWIDTPHRILDDRELVARAAAAVIDWLDRRGWFPPEGGGSRPNDVDD